MTEQNSITPSVVNQLTSMTTIEIAEYTGKRHDNVLRDTRAMLMELYGSIGTLKFEGTYIDSQNKQRPCCFLEKNDVLTLVSGYSIPLRAKIIGRLDELENRRVEVVTTITPSVTDNLEATIRAAKLFGLEGNQALLSANTAIKNTHGIDCMATLGITGLIAESHVQYFTPTIIGKPLELSARQINTALENAGFQIRRRDHKNRLIWELAENGKQYSQLIDTNKSHSDGTPIHQIKWASDVMDAVMEVE